MDLVCDGTFDTSPDSFVQVYFSMGHMGPAKKMFPCVFGLLPYKEGQTLLEAVKSQVIFQEGMPSTATSDFEKGVLHTLGNVFPTSASRDAISTRSQSSGETFRPEDSSSHSSTTALSLTTW
jgi:hypothetical protein